MDEPGKLSPTVAAVPEQLGDAEGGVRGIVEGILLRHASDDAPGHAGAIEVAWPDGSRRATVQAWLAELRELLTQEVHPELHGRAVILAAALADPVSGRPMVASGLFTAIASELREPLGEGL